MFLLRAEALGVYRGDRCLLADFSLELSAGKLVHLRGANGVGKSSLLETLAGLRAARQGRIRREPAEAAIHWLGHRNGLNPHLSPQENLRDWCAYNAANGTGIPSALTQLGLPARAQRRACRSLSAGQKRRTALARLLLAQRPLWLLDEPLDGLDQHGLALFETMALAQIQRGGAILMTSHQALPPQLRTLAVERVLGS